MTNIETLKAKVEKNEDIYLNTKNYLRTDILNYLKAMLEVREGKKLIFNDIDEDYQCCYGNATISYDGGNHPEYASNAFSELYGIGLDEKGDLYFVIEDCDEYYAERVWSVDELIDAKDLVDYILETEKENKEEE